MDDRNRNQIFMRIDRIKNIFTWHVAKPEQERHDATDDGHNPKAIDC